MSDQAKQNVELAFLSYEEGEKITKIRTVRKMSDGTTVEATLKAFSGTWAKIKSDIFKILTKVKITVEEIIEEDSNEN